MPEQTGLALPSKMVLQIPQMTEKITEIGNYLSLEDIAKFGSLIVKIFDFTRNQNAIELKRLEFEKTDILKNIPAEKRNGFELLVAEIFILAKSQNKQAMEMFANLLSKNANAVAISVAIKCMET